jgi:predicted  nucleic acid-binding Zn-ribbon protein
VAPWKDSQLASMAKRGRRTLPNDERQEPRQHPLVVFIHIPKTAGTTLGMVLRMNEPPVRVRSLGNVFKGSGGFDRGPLGRLRADGKAPVLRGARIIKGHVPFGIREFMPDDREVRYFTFLRDPVERMLSHYFQLRDNASDPNGRRAFGLPPLAPEATLKEVVDGGYLYDNLQTRMLSGLTEPVGEVTDEMLAHAKENLRQDFAVFGLVERFDESLVLLKQRLGYRNILYNDIRVNQSRPRGSAVPAELVRTAEEANRYDRELYRYAQELFDGAPERDELEFPVEAAALRAAKGEGEIQVDGPPPPGFPGDEDVWQMLVEQRALLLRQSLKLGHPREAPPPDANTAELVMQLDEARGRIRDLEQEVTSLKRRFAAVQQKRAVRRPGTEPDAAAPVSQKKAARRSAGQPDPVAQPDTAQPEQAVQPAAANPDAPAAAEPSPRRAGRARAPAKRQARRGGEARSARDEARRKGRSRPEAPADPEALSAEAQATDEAVKAANARLENLRARIQQLEDGLSANGTDEAQAAEAAATIANLRRRVRGGRQRIRTLEERKAAIERQLAGLGDERAAHG